MAPTPRKPTQDEQIRRMQEQIRRLQTRMPTENVPSIYQVTDADCNNDGSAGWFIEGFPYPSFVRSGGVVTLNGSFHLFTPYAPSRANIMDVGTIPSAFRPLRLTRTFSGGFGFTDDHLWTVYIMPNGSLRLADMHFSGPSFDHPDPAWGDATTGTQHALNLETSYPAADLGLGDYPS